MVDACCGRGIFALLLSYWTTIRQKHHPHHHHHGGNDNRDNDIEERASSLSSSTSSPIPLERIVLFDRATSIDWRHIDVANEAHVKEGRPYLDLWRGVNLHEYDNLLDRLLALTETKDNRPKASLALVGIHLCRNLSPALVGIYHGLGQTKCPYLMVAPCCLPRLARKKQHQQQPKRAYPQRQSKQELSSPSSPSSSLLSSSKSSVSPLPPPSTTTTSSSSSSVKQDNHNTGTTPTTPVPTPPTSTLLCIPINQHESATARLDRRLATRRYEATRQRRSYCYVCNKPSHRVRDCPILLNEPSQEVRTRIVQEAADMCWNCGQRGHGKADCTRPKAVRPEPPTRLMDVSGVLSGRSDRTPFLVYCEAVAVSQEPGPYGSEMVPRTRRPIETVWCTMEEESHRRL